jgi:hypothetical protein
MELLSFIVNLFTVAVSQSVDALRVAVPIRAYQQEGGQPLIWHRMLGPRLGLTLKLLSSVHCLGSLPGVHTMSKSKKLGTTDFSNRFCLESDLSFRH